MWELEPASSLLGSQWDKWQRVGTWGGRGRCLRHQEPQEGRSTVLRTHLKGEGEVRTVVLCSKFQLLTYSPRWGLGHVSDRGRKERGCCRQTQGSNWNEGRGTGTRAQEGPGTRAQEGPGHGRKQTMGRQRGEWTGTRLDRTRGSGGVETRHRDARLRWGLFWWYNYCKRD